MPQIIWFNLLLFSGGQWTYVDSFDTLEACQEDRVEYEKQFPGNYYCFPHKVQLTNIFTYEFHPRSKS